MRVLARQPLSLSGPPPPARPSPFRPPPCWRFQLPNGLRVVLVEHRATPLVHLHCAVLAGAQYDPPGHEGSASLLMSLLREGTAGRSAGMINEEIADSGADLITWADWDAGSLVLELLAEDMDSGVELIFDLLLSPLLAPAAVQSLRREQAAGCRQRQWKPAEVANERFARAVYDGTVYGRPLFGSEAGLSDVNRDALLDFHRTFFGFRNMILIGVGNFRASALRGHLEAALPSAPQGRRARPPAIAPPALPGKRVYVVDSPHALQTELRVGHASIARGHPDFARLQVLSRILDRRLNATLRERWGYCYYVRSRFAARGGPGPFITAAGVANGSVGAAVREIEGEIARLQQERIPEEEISGARNHLSGDFLRSFQSSHGVVAGLRQAAVHDLPDNHSETYLEEIDGVGQEALTGLARRHLHAGGHVVVAVGPARELHEQLAGGGRVTEFDAEAVR
jgi:zinc protease